MSKKIKIGVIGVGNMGKNHVRIFSQISQLVAVCDSNSTLVKKVATKYNVKYYMNFKDMIKSEKLDAVSVVVPTHLHRQITVYTLSNNIPTLVEKPIASNTTEARELIQTAEKNKTLLMVGHVERFNPSVIELKRMIQKKLFGTIISLLAIRVGITTPQVLEADVSLDLAIHDIDIFNYLLDEFPIRFYVAKQKIYEKNIADSATITLSYKQASGMIQTNWITPIKIRKLYITGLKAFAEVDYINQKIIFFQKKLMRNKKEAFRDILAYSKAIKKVIPLKKKEPLKVELLHFIDLVKKKKPDNTSAYYAYKALEVLSTLNNNSQKNTNHQIVYE